MFVWQGGKNSQIRGRLNLRWGDRNSKGADLGRKKKKYSLNFSVVRETDGSSGPFGSSANGRGGESKHIRFRIRLGLPEDRSSSPGRGESRRGKPECFTVREKGKNRRRAAVQGKSAAGQKRSAARGGGTHISVTSFGCGTIVEERKERTGDFRGKSLATRKRNKAPYGRLVE